jgi:hypothetical protein
LQSETTEVDDYGAKTVSEIHNNTWATYRYDSRQLTEVKLQKKTDSRNKFYTVLLQTSKILDYPTTASGL